MGSREVNFIIRTAPERETRPWRRFRPRQKCHGVGPLEVEGAEASRAWPCAAAQRGLREELRRPEGKGPGLGAEACSPSVRFRWPGLPPSERRRPRETGAL